MPSPKQGDDSTLLQNGDPAAGEAGPGPALHGEASSPDSAIGAPDAKGSRKRRLLWGGLGVVVAGAAAALVLTLPQHHHAARPVATPSSRPSPAPPPRAPFAFQLSGVTWTSYVSKDSPTNARKAAEQIRIGLSGWYDAAFVDPNEWKAGPAVSAWALFGPDVAQRARKKDAGSLSLGTVNGLEILKATDPTLSVRVLLDPSLKAVAAVATVRFEAVGTLENGDLLSVSNSARYLFRLVGSRWLIVGYPKASTTLDESPAPPVPGPTASGAGASAGPTAGGVSPGPTP